MASRSDSWNEQSGLLSDQQNSYLYSEATREEVGQIFRQTHSSAVDVCMQHHEINKLITHII